MVSLEYDRDADALYIEVRAGIVSRTRQVDSGTLVDLDEAGRLIGIEVLRPARDWPLQRVIEEYGLGPDDSAVLVGLFKSGKPFAFERDQKRELVG